MSPITNLCEPLYGNGPITGIATADVKGKRFVKSSGGFQSGPLLNVNAYGADGGNLQVAQCGAGERALGVARYDCEAESKLAILTDPGQVIPVTSGAKVEPGQEVESDAEGRAVPLSEESPGAANGYAVSAVAVGGLDLFVKLY